MSRGYRSNAGGSLLTGLLLAAGAWFLWARYLKTGSRITFDEDVASIEDALSKLPIAAESARKSLSDAMKGAGKTVLLGPGSMEDTSPRPLPTSGSQS